MEIIKISSLEKLPPVLKIMEIRKKIKKVIRKTAGLKSYEISVLITNDKIIQELNFVKRKKNKPTDVLSFPVSEINILLPHQILGEIINSIETVKVQAIKIGHSIKEEFYRLLVHGILHLLGYDHETSSKKAKKMREKEDECLKLIFDE